MTDIPQYYTELMNRCNGCGLCMDSCPSNRYNGCRPLDVMQGLDGNIIDCIGCSTCSSVCPVTDPFPVMMYMKCRALDGKVPELYYKTGFIIPEKDLDEPLVPDYKGDDVYLMPGCQAHRKFPFLEYAACEALKAIDIGCKEVPGDSCCTFPVVFRNLTNEERYDIVDKKIGKPSDGKKILTLCLGCSGELEKIGLDAEHIVYILASHTEELSKLKRIDLKVAIEPGCHTPCCYDELKAVVEALGATVINDSYGCCGKSVKNITQKLMAERRSETQGADVIVVACPACFGRYDSDDNDVPVMHISEFVAMAAGKEESLSRHNIQLGKH